MLQNIFNHWQSTALVSIAVILWVLNQVGLAAGLYDKDTYEVINTGIPVGTLFFLGVFFGKDAFNSKK